MGIRRILIAFAFTGFLVPLAASGSAPQTPATQSEIPIQHCDRLPVVILRVDKLDKRFLVDTAATSFLNAKSFTGMNTREVHVQSWNETTNLNAREISIGELALGGHSIRNVELPAIDLSAISKACGGQLDGILGVDLLERLGVTIDLERGVARLGAAPSPASSDPPRTTEMEKVVGTCSAAFNNEDVESLAACFDPEFVLRSPGGELHGRDQAATYFRQYFGTSPRAHLSMTMSDQRSVGDLVWGLYSYTMETPSRQTSGSGIMLCRKSGNRWYILSMQESPFTEDVIAKP